MEIGFGAEYLETVEAPAHGGKGTIMCSHGECWEGTIVCDGVGPCRFVKEKFLSA